MAIEVVFAISVAANIIALLIGSYVLIKKDVLGIVRKQINKPNNQSTIFGEHYDFKLDFFERMPARSEELIFLGDSLTAMCNWNELLSKQNLKNRGISGDTIKGVINRLDEVIRFQPKKIFLMIGINDLGNKKSVDQILNDYETLVSLILKKAPNTKLYIQSLLPTYDQPTRRNIDIININKRLSQLSDEHKLIFINLFDTFKTKENTLNRELSYDGLHINAEGYLLWKKAITNYVANE
ncbi:GDSL-type esterase/lipase family protein [Psychroserpens sp. XS_ASV72]|uniref:GDSL-type esterase/lipase family protein n=1 Tax=Psychroserpens sp. XS_ASV72 TaxID=3241293 RepID=UPI003514DD4B